MKLHSCTTVLVAMLIAMPAMGGSYVRVADINPGVQSAGAGGLTPYDGDLYFIANNQPGGSNNELWKWDGSQVSLAAEIRPGVTGSGINSLTAHNGELFFGAREDSGTLELWKYNPIDGASEVPDNGTWNPQNPSQLISHGGNLFYQTVDFSTVGVEMGYYDGTFQRPIDLIPGSGGSLPQHFISFDGDLYFSAATVLGSGSELTRLNTTTLTANQVFDINTTGSSSPANFAVYDNALYFNAYDGVNGNELWRHIPGSTPVTELVVDIIAGGQFDSGNPSGMFVYDGYLYFSADDGNGGGVELWRYNSVTDTAELFWNINTNLAPTGGEDPEHHANPRGFTEYEGDLYFIANDGTHGEELWATDGTTAWLVLDIYPGQFGSNIDGLTVYDNKLFFSANDNQTGSELGYYVIPEPGTIGLLGLVGFVVFNRGRKYL